MPPTESLRQYPIMISADSKSNPATASASSENTPFDTPSTTAPTAPNFCNAAQSSGGAEPVYTPCNANPPKSTMNMPTMAKKWLAVGLVAAPTMPSTNPGQIICSAPLATVISATAITSLENQSRPIMCARSEEHTSELQSLAYLVCRLLLEKK